MSKPSKRLARWIEEFQSYDLDIRYRKGKEAIVPDALSRRPDYINVMLSVLNAITDKEAYIPCVQRFLEESALPADDELKEMVVKNADRFLLGEGETLLRKIREGITAPYVEPLFRGDCIEKMHTQFGHLSYPSFASALETRAWWPTIETDVRRFVAACPNCQVAQRARPQQERELPQLMTDPFIQPFQRWGIDLIGILPKRARGNRWIIIAVDYATG